MLSHLIITWWSSLAKEAKRIASAIVKPPTTAVNRVDFLLIDAMWNPHCGIMLWVGLVGVIMIWAELMMWVGG